ncbi:hypothetical protein ILUMI_10739 [Ignelater luminosus]|uniref:NADH dehydrogenase [ubiquinone] 1 alpha subcomplex subunit 6 n=1 Tax=Ignelater luminosus TaxID=2038154 RepID=A0A8K0D6G1_IGNLU|nr:hypothetical protein ILUMI_10739 [Ignelater luminosus]
MASQAVRGGARQVKPLLSLDNEEARKRALNLYKAWYRQLPYIVRQYDIPKSVEQCRQRLREEFKKHECLTDVRVIDMLIIKGQMELKETVHVWKQKGHIMSYFKPTAEPKPTDFLSKFLQGVN